MRSQRLSRISDRDRRIEQRRETPTYEELTQFAAHENGDRVNVSSFIRGGRRAGTLEVANLPRVGIGCCRRMRRWDGNDGATRNLALRLRQTGSCLRLRFKEVRTGYLDRVSIVRRDDHANAAFGEMPQSNGKVIFQTDTSV